MNKKKEYCSQEDYVLKKIKMRKKQAELNSKDWSNYYWLARAYEELDQYSNCYNSISHKGIIENYTKVIELNPTHIEAYDIRANNYKRVNNYKKAIEDYSQIIKLEPKNAKYYFKRGDAYFCNYEHEKAKKDFTKAIDIDPSYAPIFYNDSSYTNYYGNYKKAETCYQCGLAYFKLEEYNKAIEKFIEAIKIYKKAIDNRLIY